MCVGDYTPADYDLAGDYLNCAKETNGFDLPIYSFKQSMRNPSILSVRETDNEKQ